MENTPLKNNNQSDEQGQGLVGKAKEYLQKGDGSAQIKDGTTSSKSRRQQDQDVDIRGISNILDALLAKGIVNREKYDRVKFQAMNSPKTVEDLVQEDPNITSEQIAKTYSEMRGLGYVDLTRIHIDSNVLNKIPKDIAERTQAIAYEEQPHKIKVGMVDPFDLQKVKYIESLVGKKVETYYASEDDVKNIIETRYGAQISKEVTEALEEVGDNLLDMDSASAEAAEDTGDAPIIRIVNMVLEYGITNKASDVHIEPREDKVAVRFRIRGILSEKLTIPKKLLPAVVSRIKILSNLKIDEHRIPQDGRFQVKNNNSLIDIRVSIIPSIYGEKVVMRLLEKTQGIMEIEDTGMFGRNLQKMRKALKKTQGIILVTGPTGSGKTQTLASSLKILNSPEVNIMTLEDPVEIRIDGVNQIQVNPEVGLTFSTGLRSFLRQDPDIIMVGEIRDSETANLATQAALVGRLVLSTIHTNSAAGAFARMMDMGVEPFLITSTVNIIVAQRLIRTLCECKEPYEASEEVLEELHQELDPLGGVTVYDQVSGEKIVFTKDTDKLTLYKPTGCPKCNNTGFASRTGIFEVLEMSEEIAKAVVNKSSIGEIHKIAVEQGMLTMIQDGYIKVLQGRTAFEEVLRVRNE